MIVLHVPLIPQQIDAASRLYGRLAQWKTADVALQRLHERLPGFSAEECLLKCVALNSLYGTNVLAITRMARHVQGVLANRDAHQAGAALVSSLAALPSKTDERPRQCISFAAKFCHFFVDAETYPIYDEAARVVLRLHLGRGSFRQNGRADYGAFCEQFFALRAEAGLTCTTRELDRYLWISGMYLRWLKERHQKHPRPNAELLRIFESPTADTSAELDALLPAILDRPFKGERR